MLEVAWTTPSRIACSKLSGLDEQISVLSATDT
jgi:hypothetical protein